MRISSLIGHTKELLDTIFQSSRPADSLIDSYFRSHKYLGSHDRRFIAETTYGTLRHLRKCEHLFMVAFAGNHEVDSEKDKSILLVIAYLFLDPKKGSVTPEVLLEQLCDSQLREKASLLLKNLEKLKTIAADSSIQRIGVEYSFPDWMVQRFIEQYGERESENICSSLNEQAPITLRVNTLKASVDQCQEELNKLGVETTRTILSPLGLILMKRINVFSLQIFREGWFEVQDEGSQLLPLLVDPKPNGKVLDLCAGAGGKTLEIAALMKNRGEIFATDINGFRLEELRKRAKRAGIQNVRIQEIRAVDELSERYPVFFDIVFVDAPCSGLGTIRRNPGMKWMVSEQTVHEVSEKQKAILHSAVPLLKPDGVLVYATCTLLKQENEDVLENFIVHHPDFKIVRPSPGLSLLKTIDMKEADTLIKLLPHTHGTDGFFCAFLKREKVH